MKKRHLRKWIEHLICTITALLILFICMIDRIELKFIPTMLMIVMIIAVNLLILKKYGKGIWYGNN